MLAFDRIEWLPVLVGLLAHMLLGAAYFGVLAEPWASRAHPGKSREDLQKGPKWIYAIAALGGLVTAIVLAALLESLGATSVADALVVVLALWVGFVVAKYATTYAFEYRSWTLLAIDVGYPLLSMAAMALAYVLWP